MSMDFEDPIEPNDIEDEAPARGGSRLFVILAVGLTGLIVLGLVAIAGVIILRRVNTAQNITQQALTPTPTLSVVGQLQPTNTPPPTIAPTDTPEPATIEPTPTPTPVVRPTDTPEPAVVSMTATAAARATAQAPPTNTPTPVVVANGGDPASSGDSPAEVPNTGAGEFGLAMAAALGLLVVLFVTRRLRQAT